MADKYTIFMPPGSEIMTNVEGLVKFYHYTDGVGFAGVPNLPRDVVFYAEVLHAAGFITAFENAPINMDVLKHADSDKLKAVRINRLENYKGIYTPPPQAEPSTHRGPSRLCENPTHGPDRAIVRWFNRARGFGFLTLVQGENMPEIFVHIEQLRKNGLGEEGLKAGQEVSVLWGIDEKGAIAGHVELLPPSDR